MQTPYPTSYGYFSESPSTPTVKDSPYYNTFRDVNMQNFQYFNSYFQLISDGSMSNPGGENNQGDQRVLPSVQPPQPQQYYQSSGSHPYYFTDPYKEDAQKSPNRGQRTAFTVSQLSHLEKAYSEYGYLSKHRKIVIAEALNLTEKQVKTWFQNRRSRDRKQGITPPSLYQPWNNINGDTAPSSETFTAHQDSPTSQLSPDSTQPESPVKTPNFKAVILQSHCLKPQSSAMICAPDDMLTDLMEQYQYMTHRPSV